MNKINFHKFTSSGNDFVLIDNRQGIYLFDWIKLAPQICNRHIGVGADGIIIVENSNKADFKMNYFNPDGSYGIMCGNGGLTSALFYFEHANSTLTRFEALNFIYEAEFIQDNKIKLKMKSPNLLRLCIKISLFNNDFIVHFIDTGAPHAVLFIDELSSNIKLEILETGIKKFGSLIRYHDTFKPGGTNVNLVEIIDKHNISIRTYERGVEDETYSCGTGAIASSIISSIVRNINNKVNVRTKSGEILTVCFDRVNTSIDNVELIGNVRKVFNGEYFVY